MKLDIACGHHKNGADYPKDIKMDEELFHRLAEEVERDYQVGGLSGGLYEDYAHDIFARYLAAQQETTWTCECGWTMEIPPQICVGCGKARSQKG
jgi:hypothetical protein